MLDNVVVVIRKAGRKDLLLIRLADGASAAGVFTRNRFCAAPVQICRTHLGAGRPIRALLINSGCANAGTGASGLADATRTCEAVAKLLGCEPHLSSSSSAARPRDCLDWLAALSLHCRATDYGDKRLVK